MVQAEILLSMKLYLQCCGFGKVENYLENGDVIAVTLTIRISS